MNSKQPLNDPKLAQQFQDQTHNSKQFQSVLIYPHTATIQFKHIYCKYSLILINNFLYNSTIYFINIKFAVILTVQTFFSNLKVPNLCITQPQSSSACIMQPQIVQSMSSFGFVVCPCFDVAPLSNLPTLPCMIFQPPYHWWFPLSPSLICSALPSFPTFPLFGTP